MESAYAANPGAKCLKRIVIAASTSGALMALMAASMWYAEKRADVDFISYAIAAGH